VLVVFFGVQIVVGVVVGIIAGVAGASMAIAIAIATVISFLACVFAIPLFVQAWGGRPWRSRIGLKILGLSSTSSAQLTFGAIAGFALAVLLAGLMAAWPVPDDFKPGPVAELIADSKTAHLIFAIGAVLLAPLVEEMTFRGTMYAGLRKRLRPAGAAISITALFTVIHFSEIWGYWPAIVAIGTLSAGTMAFRMGTGSARPAIMMHFVYNLVVTFVPAF